MRKVFALFMGLILLATLAACSSDDTPTPPNPTPNDLSITTAAVPAGCVCAPYNMMLAAAGGTAPYTWALAPGSDPLPAGVTLSAEGRLLGIVNDVGAYSFTVRVTDSSAEPESVDKTFAMNVSIPANPSLAIYFDNTATVCSTDMTSFSPIDCYIYIMLEDSEMGCAQATEFKLSMTDINGLPLEAGVQYGLWGEPVYGDFVAVTIGNLFDGLAMSFNRPMFGPDPILIASFPMTLFENIDNLSFNFEANPGGYLAVVSCEEGYPIVEVNGRAAAVNY